MTTFHTGSSIGGTLSDLDGFSVPEDNFFAGSAHHHASDDFGFDPPTIPNTLKMHQTYSPPGDSQSPLSIWPSFNQPKDELSSLSPGNTELDRLIAQTLPSASTALSRYGQVTPPRSNSESSESDKLHADAARAISLERRGKRTTKAPIKQSEPTTAAATTSKKRRNTRKSSVSTTGNQEEDDKRRHSLEKNRLAAAKCRVNKKEKTEQLQRDSHDKAVHNAFLKEQIMRMKEEVQQMNALLLGHASCEGCKSPDDIQKHLSNLGNEFFTHQMSSVMHPDFSGYSSMAMDIQGLDDTQMMQDNYFSSHDPHSSMLNPPLPEFDREPDFDLQTPMHTD